ncbi:MAG: hypothetical protein II747_04870 [Clostridia bacterium]|nr:hypothetical protein [Clostridia bacterium]
MGLKEVASAASLWRGWDYYKESRVLKWEQTGENTYDGIVKGSEDNSYPYAVLIKSALGSWLGIFASLSKALL